MKTREIPKELWQPFLTHLSQAAAQRPVRLELAQEDVGDQPLDDHAPLREIELATKGSAEGDVLISVGLDTEVLTHVVHSPVRLLVGEGEGEALEWLAFEDASRGKLLVHFEEPARLKA